MLTAHILKGCLPPSPTKRKGNFFFFKKVMIHISLVTKETAKF